LHDAGIRVNDPLAWSVAKYYAALNRLAEEK